MHETLFKSRSALARYRNGQHYKEREHFIEQCAQRGYSHSMLQKIAWVLLAVADSIDLDHGRVTREDIELAVTNRSRFKHTPAPPMDHNSSRQLFEHIASEWVSSLGNLELPPKKTSPFSEHIRTFANHLRDERGLSSVTISTCCERMVWFFDSLQSPHGSLQAITVNDVLAFIEAKGKQGWKRSSLAALASSLRTFFRYAEDQGWCSSGITTVIEAPRIYAREGLPRGPNWDVVQKLLKIPNGDCPADIRNNPILILLAVYGLRRGEVASLRIEDLDWINERITISRPKQHLIQCYPLLPQLGEAILRYLREVRPSCAQRNLFLTLNAPIRPLSAQSITPIVRSRLSAMGVTLKPRGAHCLRHACAMHLLTSGFSLKEISDYLGHRTMNSTMDYAKIDLSGLRQVADLDLGMLL